MLKNLTKYLLLVTVFSIPFYFWRFNIGPIPTTVLEILIYTTFILGLLGGYLKGLIKNNKTAFYAGLVFVSAGLISAFIDPGKARALGLFKAYFFDGFLFFCLILQTREEEPLIKETLVVSAVFSSVIALIYYCAGVRTDDNRLYDLARISPNYLAMFLSPIFILSIALGAYKWRKNWPYLLSAVVLITTLYYTGSRGALLAVIAGLLTVVFGQLILSGKRYAKPVLAMLFVLLIGGSYLVYKPDWSDHARKATSSNVRYYIWTTSLEIIGKNPVWGVGLSNYQPYFSTLTQDRVNFPEFISPVALTAHNLYLQMYAVGGIILFVSFMIFVLLTQFWRLNDLGASAALVAILVYSLVDTPFFRNDLAIVFWLILAILYALRQTNKTVKNNE